MAAAFISLSINEIVYINRQMINTFGGAFLGKDNLKNPDSLNHVLWAVQGSLFGVDPYPRIVDKAAIIGWRIIAGHVFHDGNKRTGMESCRQILELNGLRMIIDQDTVDIAFAIAKNELSVEAFTSWLEQKLT